MTHASHRTMQISMKRQEVGASSARLRQERSDLSYCSLPTPLQDGSGVMPHAACRCRCRAKWRAFQAAGPRFQVMVPDRRRAQSRLCCGGVSAVISASDFDELTFHPLWLFWHQSNRSLLLGAKNPIINGTCPSSDEGQKRLSVDPLRSAQLVCCWCLGFLLRPWRKSPFAAATTTTPAGPLPVKRSGWPASTHQN